MCRAGRQRPRRRRAAARGKPNPNPNPNPNPTLNPNPNANPKACGLLEFAVDSRADSLAAASREGGAAPLLLWAVEPDTKARKQPGP